MNTSTRVEFGLYDVTARSDSAPVTEDAKDFCNLSKDLLLESVPNQNKYGTLETRQWLMDGSFLFFPKRLGSISGAFGARNSRTETALLPIRPC